MGESEPARNDRCGNGDVDPGRRRERIGSVPGRRRLGGESGARALTVLLSNDCPRGALGALTLGVGRLR